MVMEPFDEDANPTFMFRGIFDFDDDNDPLLPFINYFLYGDPFNEHALDPPNPVAHGTRACKVVVLMAPEVCSVCLEDMTGTLQLPCGHSFHTVCIEAWFRRNLTCPTCRTPVPIGSYL